MVEVGIGSGGKRRERGEWIRGRGERERERKQRDQRRRSPRLSLTPRRRRGEKGQRGRNKISRARARRGPASAARRPHWRQAASGDLPARRDPALAADPGGPRRGRRRKEEEKREREGTDPLLPSSPTRPQRPTRPPIPPAARPGRRLRPLAAPGWLAPRARGVLGAVKRARAGRSRERERVPRRQENAAVWVRALSLARARCAERHGAAPLVGELTTSASAFCARTATTARRDAGCARTTTDEFFIAREAMVALSVCASAFGIGRWALCGVRGVWEWAIAWEGGRTYRRCCCRGREGAGEAGRGGGPLSALSRPSRRKRLPPPPRETNKDRSRLRHALADHTRTFSGRPRRAITHARTGRDPPTKKKRRRAPDSRRRSLSRSLPRFLFALNTTAPKKKTRSPSTSGPARSPRPPRRPASPHAPPPRARQSQPPSPRPTKARRRAR